MADPRRYALVKRMLSEGYGVTDIALRHGLRETEIRDTIEDMRFTGELPNLYNKASKWWTQELAQRWQRKSTFVVFTPTSPPQVLPTRRISEPCPTG